MRTPGLCTFAVLTLLLALPSCQIKGIQLLNQTESVLTPYRVVTTPPPPHRLADPTGDVDPQGMTAIDPDGFNPLYYTADPTPTDRGNGLIIQISNDDPPVILVRVFHHVVEPGKESSADTQPVKLHEVFASPTEENVRITVRANEGTPGGWAVAIDGKK